MTLSCEVDCALGLDRVGGDAVSCDEGSRASCEYGPCGGGSRPSCDGGGHASYDGGGHAACGHREKICQMT